MGASKLRVVVLGAGFGGLELTSILSGQLGDRLDLTIIERSDHFYFGYSKLDVMYGRRTPPSVKYPYKAISMDGVEFRQEQILSIDPVTREVETNQEKYHADVLVVALGADYDIEATPGLSEGGNEFYSFKGAVRAATALREFTGGHVMVAVTGFPFKCPPAPSEAALLLDEFLTGKGIRKNSAISLVMPFELPIPPSRGSSRALLKAFRKKNIEYIPEMMVWSIDPAKKMAELDDGREVPFDLFLGIPEHRVPEVLEESGLLFDDWVPVDRANMKTRYENVYAIGDVTSVGVPKAGLYAVSAARSAAECIISEYLGKEFDAPFDGKGRCYIEFGQGLVGRADVDFFTPGGPTGSHQKASTQIARDKKKLEEEMKSRWFG
jgi:sulfide:quinone oxidoreductase